jgi:hypothetical protein
MLKSPDYKKSTKKSAHILSLPPMQDRRIFISETKKHWTNTNCILKVQWNIH